MLNHPIPGEKPSIPFIRSFYVREWVRHVHSHLDQTTTKLPQQDVTFDLGRDVSESFRLSWLQDKPWWDGRQEELKIVTKPVIYDVETPSWANLSKDQQKIVCQAGHLGALHRSDSELENPRKDLAIGMASLEILQTLTRRQYTVSLLQIVEIFKAYSGCE